MNFKKQSSMQRKKWHTIRLLCFVLLCSWEFAHAAYAQQISLNLKNASLKQVIEVLTKQSGYTFFYDQKYLTNAKPITIQVKNQSLQQVMQLVFDGQPFVYDIVEETITLKPKQEVPQTKSSLAQDQKVSGVVTDSLGNPLAGVSVRVKGLSKGTVTNAEGQFVLDDVKEGDVLVFSYIGSVAQELPAMRGSMQVVLREDSDVLDEVVVVGYGTTKKSNLTSAVSQVDTKLLENRPSPTVANMLQGAAPGLVVSRNSGRPGAQGLNLQIRGATSANGNVDPLVIIDGVVSSQSSFLALNPNDIKNISILKDGGATAIYGAQSAGGVILVTTKGGTKGASSISLVSNVALQRPGNIPNRLSLIDEMNYMNLARANAGLAPEYTEEDLNYAVNGPTFVLGDNGLWRTYNQQNIIEQVIKDTYPILNNNIQAAGGSDAVTYMVSLGNMTQNGIFKVGDDRFSRWNARANLSARVNKYLNLDLRSAYTDEATDNPQDGGWGLEGGGNSILRQFFSSRMRFPIFNEDGTYYRSGTSSAYGYALLKDGGFNTDRKKNYANNITLTVDSIAKGLQFRFLYSRENITRENRNFRRTVTFYSGPEESSASKLNDPNNYAITNYTTLVQNYQAIADYDLKMADNHNIHLMAGYQFFDYDDKYISASTKNLYVNDNPSLNFTADPANKSHTQYGVSEAMQSYFGRFNYDYQGKYLFEATVRSDESSRLTKEDRRKVFPSFSAGWNITQEDWFSLASNVLGELKPRLSWGKVGSSVGIGYFDYFAGLSTGTSLLINNARQVYLSQGGIPATDLTWETVETRNIGVDFSLLNRKLKGSFDYFNKYNNNMLVNISLPATIGIDVPKSNDGKLKTWGWEAALSYDDKIGNDFSYGVALNIADNQNKLVRFGGTNNIVNPGVNGLVEGYALNSIWAYKTDGYFQNENDLVNAPSYSKLLNVAGVPGLGDVRYVDMNGDGEISPGEGTLADMGDLVYLGDINPRYQYGLNINLAYKNIDFSIFIQGIGKRNFKPSNELIQPALYSYYLPMDFHMDYWTPDNRDADYPRPYLSGTHNFVSSDKWFLNGSYARLKNIQIGYTLSKRTMPALPFSRIRFYLSGEDLLTFSKLGIYKGVIDPELKPEDGKISPYPFATTISFGLNVDF